MLTTTVLCALLVGAPPDRVPAQITTPTPHVQRIMAAVSPDRIRATIDGLVAFGTRHTLSDVESDDRGIGAARRWILSQMNDAGGVIEARLDPHDFPPGRRLPDGARVVNVIAVIPGTMPQARDRLYLVLGHYDSRNGDGMDATGDAPGANDDGSGTAVVMELARVLAEHPLESTVMLVATAAEEQGLYGASGLAEALRAAGADVRGVLSNDIVGDPRGPDGRLARGEIRVFSEGLELAIFQMPDADDDAGVARALRQLSRARSMGGESDAPSRQLARFIAAVAVREQTAVKPRLIFRADRFLRGGDHTSFNRVGYAGVRFTEVYENYDHQHQDVRVEDGVQMGDLPEFVDEHYLADVTRLNAAALVHLANAPSTPTHVRIIAAQLSNDTMLRWDASPEPDTAGYEIVWRATTSPVWQYRMDVGDVTEATIDLSKDNWFFGVRAYDQDGYRSPAAFPVAARE